MEGTTTYKVPLLGSPRTTNQEFSDFQEHTMKFHRCSWKSREGFYFIGRLICTLSRLSWHFQTSSVNRVFVVIIASRIKKKPIIFTVNGYVVRLTCLFCNS